MTGSDFRSGDVALAVTRRWTGENSVETPTGTRTPLATHTACNPVIRAIPPFESSTRENESSSGQPRSGVSGGGNQEKQGLGVLRGCGGPLVSPAARRSSSTAMAGPVPRGHALPSSAPLWPAGLANSSDDGTVLTLTLVHSRIHRLSACVCSFFCFCFLVFCHSTGLVGSWFPDQGSNPCPLQWKHRFLTTGPPGNALRMCLLSTYYMLALGQLVELYHHLTVSRRVLALRAPGWWGSERVIKKSHPGLPWWRSG